MARRAAWLLLCLAVLCSAVVTGCGSRAPGSGQPAETNKAPTISTESQSCQPRGTGLVSVSALPSKQPLSTTSANSIELRQKLAFAVTVLNSGCQSEKEIAVTLSITGGEQRLTSEGRIDRIDPGEEKTAVLEHVGLPDFQKRLLVRIEVEPVPAEMTTENNSADYPVTFVLTP